MNVETYWFSDREQQAPFIELIGDRGTAVFERSTSTLEVWAEDEEGEIADVSPKGLPVFDDDALIAIEIAEFIEAVPHRRAATRQCQRGPQRPANPERHQ